MKTMTLTEKVYKYFDIKDLTVTIYLIKNGMSLKAKITSKNIL